MKAIALASLSLLLVAATAGAQILHEETGFTRIERPAGAPATVHEAVQNLRSRVHANVINLDSHSSSFVIPIAGNAQGNGGTYFRSDFTIANYRSSAQRISVSWLAQGQNNANSPVTYFNLPANTTVAQDDFVGISLGKTGLGGVAVIGVDSNGNSDDNAQLDGFSRIWTPQPGSAGSVSQNFDAVSLTDSIGSITAYIVGLKQSSAFRSNIGVVNLDSSAHSWTARSLYTGVATTLTVQPYSVTQTGLAAGSGSSGGNLSVSLNSDGFGFFWTAYASSTDNVTGDGWVARAKQ